jgi:hypothetical protein
MNKQIDSGIFGFHIQSFHESTETTLYEPYESAQRKGEYWRPVVKQRLLNTEEEEDLEKLVDGVLDEKDP